ncbi:MAG: sodium:solute symporter [Phycisphaerales bacterium]
MLALAADNLPATPGFDRFDWLVLGAYFALLIGTGVWFSWRQSRSTADYFLASRQMPVWAVAFSILATAQSAATFVGAPEMSYRGDLSYLSTNLGGILAALILAAVFIPIYYRLGVSTPYQLLESRFGPGAKIVASITYMIGRVFAGGARLFIGALPFSLLVFGDVHLLSIAFSIAIFTAFGILYTLWGGVSSVIWTDVIQVCVYLGATVAALVVLLHLIPVGLPDIFHALRHPIDPASGQILPSKLNLLSLGLDPSKPMLGFDPGASISLLTVITGFTLLTIASHGADQDLVQRMLTCKSPLLGSLSVISGVLVGIPAVFLFLCLGLLLFIFYQRPDIMGQAAPTSIPETKHLVMSFSLQYLPPGLAGLMLAGLLAAGPCGINASLNSMSSTFVSDVYRPHRPGRHERHYLLAGRLGVVGAGIVVGAFALACHWIYNENDTTLIDFALGVMNFAYAGLLGVFFTALFSRRGSVWSCVASIITGFVVIALMQPVTLGALSHIVDPLLHRVFTPAHSLAGVKIAFPWQLLIGATICTSVCMIGNHPARALPQTPSA